MIHLLPFFFSVNLIKKIKSKELILQIIDFQELTRFLTSLDVEKASNVNQQKCIIHLSFSQSKKSTEAAIAG